MWSSLVHVLELHPAHSSPVESHRYIKQHMNTLFTHLGHFQSSFEVISIVVLGIHYQKGIILYGPWG